MRDKILQDIKKRFKKTRWENNHEIFFGYDCLAIEFTEKGVLVTSDLIDELKSILKTNLAWASISEDGNLLLSFDITDYILEEFGYWERYDKEYGFDEVKGDFYGGIQDLER